VGNLFLKMEIKGVFFDLFGTLINIENTKSAWADWLSIFYEILVQNGLKISKDQFSKNCDDFMNKEEPPESDDNLTVYERRIKRLCKQLELTLNNKIINKIALLTIGEWGKHFDIDPEIYSLLSLLKKSKKLALITNYDHYPYIKKLLKNLNLAEYFESITISSEIGKKKPDPEIFLPAIEKSGLKPSEIVYIGDSDVDIIGAKAAGMIPILIQRNYEYSIQDFKSEGSKTKKPTFSHFQGIKEIKKISDLKNLLLK